jgi:hypothetical protein
MDLRYYYKASKHDWGEGKMHVLDDTRSKTLCGKSLANCPGEHVPPGVVDCQGCLAAIERRNAREEADRQARSDWEAMERQGAAKTQAEGDQVARAKEWWRRYHAYMQSAEWKRKRMLVLKREDFWCESCRERPATTAHHLTYAHVGHEPLFELKAICGECHKQLTDEDRKRAHAAAVRFIPETGENNS